MTLRELVAMTECRQSDQWNHTSAMLAMLVNVNRDPKKRPVPADAFHPQRQRAASRPANGNVRMLKSVFVDHSPME